MRGYKLAAIFIAVLIVGGGIGFVVTGFATAGSMEYNYDETYDPSSPDTIEDLHIFVDIGKVIIQYNTSATSHYADIDVDMKMTGLFMAGKSYTDFFNPSTEWWDESSATFSIEAIPGFWIDPAQWFKSYNINVTITLRTDVVYDLQVGASTGAIEMDVPDNVILNSTSLHTSTGSVTLLTSNAEFLGEVSMESSTGKVEIFAANTNFTHGYDSDTSTGSVNMNFTNCLMGDDIVGHVSTGGITYKSYNMVYSQDINIDLDTSTGSVKAYIYQYVDMDANVTGAFETSTGSIEVFYRDTLSNTGIRCSGFYSTGSVDYTAHATMEILGSVYQSLNYGTATRKYTFTLTTSTGGINGNCQSA